MEIRGRAVQTADPIQGHRNLAEIQGRAVQATDPIQGQRNLAEALTKAAPQKHHRQAEVQARVHRPGHRRQVAQVRAVSPEYPGKGHDSLLTCRDFNYKITIN